MKLHIYRVISHRGYLFTLPTSSPAIRHGRESRSSQRCLHTGEDSDQQKVGFEVK